MELKKGDFFKHFKGKTLEEKKICEVLETGVTYSGDNAGKPLENMVVYKNIFQGRIFVREMDDLLSELPIEKQQEFGQVHRVEKLTDEEKELVLGRKNETNIVEC